MPDAVADIRRFNRFYTRRIGLLDEHLPGSSLALPEARIVYELARGPARTAAELCRSLDMDKGHLSRVVARLASRGLVTGEPSPGHARHRRLALTPEGLATFEVLERGTVGQIEALLDAMPSGSVPRLLGAMREVEAIMSCAEATAPFALRDPRPGDLGHITARQAALYAAEYGWDWTYEGLVASILGRFVETFDPAHEQAWVAERAGAVAGSVFLMRGDDPEVARLRLLYVEPSARGLGLGSALVDACIGRAREIGYRGLTLWTNDVLVSARRIYQAAGFALVDEQAHRSFGKDLVGQTWRLSLDPPAPSRA